jgi:C4-type Zn-finger protein
MPYVPRTFGLKFQIRLRDLCAGDVVRVLCPICGARYAVAPHQLLARYPGFMPIVAIEKQMRCKRCPHRGSMTWHVETAVPPVS